MPIHAASDPIMTALLNELNTLRALKDQIYADAVKLDEELADVNQMQRAIMQALADMYGERWKDHAPDSVRRQCESLRYIGAYTMAENDVLAGGDFDDEVAYGGWTMDDHHPAGFRTAEPPTIFHPAPSPYGIPYRCLYSESLHHRSYPMQGRAPSPDTGRRVRRSALLCPVQQRGIRQAVSVRTQR